MKQERGCLQVYTGTGKGKSTAAFGLALRSAGAGKKVFIAQFVKGMDYSELKSISCLKKWIFLKQYGRKGYIVEKPLPEDRRLAKKGLAEAALAMKKGRYDLVILDEACIALFFKLYSVSDLLSAIKGRAFHVEVVVTGRYAPPLLIKTADLVTEMKEIKHYYNQGINARVGIEK
ncbi:MAG: cob(I)yrinic acid a,c-diamide adenosyltransferase [Elusimicrobia bacterium RIFOXYB2_FULL_49_7]|nr:MAG: cob(I)yrinic acid a,c-diamide adenosyltransferase [Elusimicrobia bacterium RIFOXYB2_FULL_49_7]